MDWYLYLAVVGVGLVAGIINTLAAGGSLLTLPLLIIPLGIPSTSANAINRIAILLQNIVDNDILFYILLEILRISDLFLRDGQVCKVRIKFYPVQ